MSLLTGAVAEYSESPTALTNGNKTLLNVDANRNLKVANAGPDATAIGTTADAAVSTDTTGTLSGKLRGLVKILADVWDSTTGRLKVIAGLQYNATPPILADTDKTHLQGDAAGNLKVTTARLDKVNDAVTAYLAPADSRVAITASAQILAGPGKLRGFWIVSHTAGATVRFSDALTATAPYVSSAWTSAAGHLAGDYIMLSQNGMRMATGCYVTISGTIEILVDAMTD